MKHRYERERYFAAQKRAEYYLWCALRGHVLAGNDPITGRKRSLFNPVHVAEARAAYKAMYRVARARKLEIAAAA